MTTDPAHESQSRSLASRHDARADNGEIRFKSPPPRSAGVGNLVIPVIASLLMWAVVLLISDGNWQSATQVIGTSMAAEFAGRVIGSDA